MPFGPVFDFELASAARRPRFYAWRFVYGLVLLGVIASAFRDEYGGLGAPGPGSPRVAQFARPLFARLVTAQGLAVLALTPALVAGAVAREVQRKTLYALLTSDLSSGEIIVGKLAARLLNVGVLVAAGLPILLAVGLAAGLSPWFAVLSASATFSTAFFVAALSILASTQTRSVRGALNFTYMVVMAWLILPCAVGVLWPRATPAGEQVYQSVIRPLNGWLSPTTPFALWLDVERGAVRGAGDLAARVGWMAGLQAGYASALAGLAVAALRPTFARQGGARKVPRTAGDASRRSRPPRPCGDDPMLWKELFAPRFPSFYRHLGLAISLALAGLLAWGTVRFAAPAVHELWQSGYGVAAAGSARAQFLLYLRVVGTGIYLVYCLGVASDAAASIAAEREKDTWVSLVTTPLTGAEIVRAKMLGAVWGIRHTATVLVLLWLAGAAAGSVHPLAIVAVLIELAAFTGFAAALGAWVSLRAKDATRAVALATLTLLVLNGGSLLLTLSLRPGGPLAYVGCTPFLIASALASHADLAGRPSHAVLGLVSDASLSALWTAHGAELGLTCLLGVLAYALGAWALTRATCRGFDARLDRPPVTAEARVERSRAATPRPHLRPGVATRVRARG
jgi:ABC-type transport system involved in multi-copper enzyme maturation permease subunit